MVTTIDAANGDTAYPLAAAQVFALGDKADGAGLWVCNADAVPNTVTVEWSGSHAGVGRLNLTGKGDTVWIPAGDVTMVTVTASAYPTTIGWAYTDPGMRVESGQKR